MNKMKEIRIEKVVLNMGIGDDGDIKSARKILKKIAGIKPKTTRTKKRTTFNVAKGKKIGCMVTIRKTKEKILERLFKAIEGKLSSRVFDKTGNFSFGISEYITVPEVDYDPSLPILGFDVAVRLERPGYRVARKRLGSKIGENHRITKEEAIDFVKNNFEVEIDEK